MKTLIKLQNIILLLLISTFSLLPLSNLLSQSNLTYPIVDTKQSIAYDSLKEISLPSVSNPFYGQDANYQGNQPNYVDNGDGTISDLVTGLMWQKSPDLNGDGTINYDDKLSYDEAMAAADTFNLAGYDDWRLPDIKEAYSLIVFSGIDPSGYNGSVENLVPFIDTDYFDFGYGDESAGERIIDAQFASSTLYVGTTMNGDETMFGVNFADGRIKGYPTAPMPGQTEDKQFYVMYVRGNDNYGINNFTDNGNGTITDNSTGLMWSQDDNGSGLSWEDALIYAENASNANYTDWRLPNVKELQSIVDYTRSPQTTNSPAIDPLFNCSSITDEGGSANYPFYWSGTTHANMQSNPGSNAAYVCFGEALGFMEEPPGSGNYTLMDVHGAGAQRSDPKVGDPDDYPFGHGPQGDVIRIYNYVRLVRDASATSTSEIINETETFRVYPNPATNYLTIESKNDMMLISIGVYNLSGAEIINEEISTSRQHKLNIQNLLPGIYILKINCSKGIYIKKIVKQ